MKTIENIIKPAQTVYLSDFFAAPEKILFFDIETTGLSPKGASIYLIGCTFYRDGSWRYRQYFAQTPAEEAGILREFLSFAAAFSHFIHFNGTTFDIPFLQAKCKKHALPVFTPESHWDIYRHIKPYKNLLHLPGCRQKQLEVFLGLNRQDPFDGGQLIELYRIYSETLDEKLLSVLLLHNAEDLEGMLLLFRIMAMPLLFEEGRFSVSAARLSPYRLSDGSHSYELLLTLSLTARLPVSISCHTANERLKGCFLSAQDKKAVLKIPVFCGELKYFYPDYKNYAYLPEEDQAIHKSVAVYVDKSRRQPATAATCYTKKSGRFLPLYLTPKQPAPFAAAQACFYPQHKAKEVFFLPEESFYSDKELLREYTAMILRAFPG